MKRVIKSSFGLRDEDWVNPPDDYWVGEDGDYVVDVTPQVLSLDSDGYVDYDEMDEYLDKVVDGNIYDDTYNFLVSNREDTQQALADAIDSKVSELEIVSGSVRVSGEMTVHYEFLRYDPPSLPYSIDRLYDDEVIINYDSIEVSYYPDVTVEKVN